MIEQSYGYNYSEHLIKEGSKTGFNSQHLSDLKLRILSKNEALYCQLWISKIKLMKVGILESQVMDGSKTGQREFTHYLEEDVHMIHFLDALRSLYKKEPLESPPDQYFSILNVALKYDIPRTIKMCLKLLGEQKMNFKDALNLLKYAEQFERYETIIKQDLLKNAEAEILKRFPSTRDIFVISTGDDRIRMEEFKTLPLGAILALIRSDNFKVDSENSIFYASLLWLDAQQNFDQPKKEDIMKKILPHIRFPQLRLHFLLDIVPEISKKFSNKNISQQIDELYDFALECRVGGKNRIMAQKATTSPHLIPQITPRATFKDGHIAFLRYTFINISKWEINTRYFSPIFIVNGYEWYFFLKSKLMDGLPLQEDMMETDGNTLDRYTLAVYLRCHSKFMPEKQYLPICATLSIQLKSSSERKFKFNVIFERPDKAIGGLITEQDETWPNIITGKSQIVFNNTITLTFSLEFLEPGGHSELCQTVE